MVISLVLAGALVVGADLAGRMPFGAGVGIGLVLGALNGFFIKATLDRGLPILATSLVRLALFTLLALLVARLVGISVWPVVAGIAAAQVVTVGLGVRQGLGA
jgi:hypothetical protein